MEEVLEISLLENKKHKRSTALGKSSCPHGPIPNLQLTIVDDRAEGARPFLIHLNTMPVGITYSAPFMVDYLML